MIKELIKYLADKKILILGFGKEGRSTYHFIREYLKDKPLTIVDKNENLKEQYPFLQNDCYVTCLNADGCLAIFKDYDIIMKSPGISLVGMDVAPYISKMTSQLELLLEFFPIFTIGVTGTKGKSTTSSLIYSILKEQNKECMLLGNIGIPVFNDIDAITKNTILVLEMSSHQLEYMDKSPSIAIMLNLFEEHLDHYASFEKYAEAKCNIYKFQNSNNYFIYNADNALLSRFIKHPPANTYTVSMKKDANICLKQNMVYFNNTPIYDTTQPRILLGDYNLNNIMFALAVAKLLNLDMEQAIKSVNNFHTLKHRLEFVGKYDDVIYYDNAIATVPMATIEAIKALKIVDTLIIGGMDRGIDYSGFINYLSNSSITNIICMPKTGHDIAKKLKRKNVYITQNLEDTVAIAKKVTAKGKICLLSPAAASYGFFKNFEEKGDLFQKLVKLEVN